MIKRFSGSKGLGILLAFSIGLNIGVIFTVITHMIRPPDPSQPEQGLETALLIEMTLPDDVREQVSQTLRQMMDDHHAVSRQLHGAEDKIMAVIARPGDLDMDAFNAQVDALHQILEQVRNNRTDHIIAIRNLIGGEKTVALLSKIRLHKLHRKKPWRNVPD